MAKTTLAALEPQITRESSDPNLHVVTTLRYDKRLTELTRRIPIAMEDSYEDKFFLARLHYQRLKHSAQLFGWPELKYDQFCEALDQAVADFDESAARIRVEYTSGGSLTTVVSPVPLRDNLFSGLSDLPLERESHDPVFDVVIDSQQTPASLFTFIKTNQRDAYDQARKRNHIEIGTNKEVLLVNDHNDIVEGSISSVAIQCDDGWITPPAESTMCGVLRSFLLNLGVIREGAISKESIQNGANVLLFNGVMGVVKGVINTTH